MTPYGRSLRDARRVLLLLTVWLAAGIPGFVLLGNARTPGISGVNVVFQRLSTEQGLSNNSVWAITQDKQGFVWIGTTNGLNRFDGKRCLVYHAGPDSTSLSDNWIWSLFSDRDSCLWIGTNHGLNKFDPRTLTFQKYLHDPANPASLSHNEVSAIYRDRAGTLWVGTKRGLNRFEHDTGTWTHFLPTPDDATRPGDNFVRAIVEDNEGSLWIETGNFAMNGGGIFNFDKNRGDFARIGISRTRDYSGGFIATGSEDVAGNLWLCTSDKYGPHWLDQIAGAISPHSSTSGPSHLGMSRGLTYKLWRVCQDRHGAIWVGNFGGGLFRYEPGTRQFRQYTVDLEAPSALSSAWINLLFIDRSGLLWVGTDNMGVNSFSTKPFLASHTIEDSLIINNRFGVTFADKAGNLWIGSLRYEPKTHRYRYPLRNIVLTHLCQDGGGTIWASDMWGLAKYVPGKDNGMRVWWLPLAGLDEITTFVFVDSKNLIWLGTQGGVYRLQKDLSSYTRFNLDHEKVGGILGGRVTSIYEDKAGTIWVGTITGLNRYEQETGSFKLFSHDVRDPASLSDSYCTGILEDALGRLWISTAMGLDLFNPISQTFTRYLHQPVGRIVADRRGRFWFGSVGISHASVGRLSMYNPVDGQLRTYDESDGLPGEEIMGWPQTLLESGELVFGTYSRIVVFHPDSVQRLCPLANVVITGIKLFDKPVPLRTASDLLREIQFEHHENVLSIEYAALSYDMPEYNQYAYMLEGFDKHWVYCGNRQEATYTNLDPETYTFRVKGSNHDGVWNEAGTSLAIVIRPAYWQTWWFRGLMIVAMVGLGGSVVGYAERIRARRKIERLEGEHALERERTRISQDMHDEVGSSLSEIAILSELVKRDLRKPESAEVQVQQISDRAAELIDNVSEIVWAMNPKNDTLEDLLGHIRRYAVKYLDLAGIACEFHAPEMIPPLPVPSDIRRNLFLVVKEALHNVVKHSCASAVCIDVSLHGVVFEMKIKDNGHGFVVDDHRNTGNGLANMRKRMTDIGGTCRIESTPDGGTEIIVTGAPLQSP